MSLFSRYVEIYDFARGVDHWRYTEADRAIVVETQTYAPVPGLKRGRITRSGEENKSGLEITAPLSLDLLALWRPYPPTERVTLRLRRVRKSDGVVSQAFSGVVSDVEDDEHGATLRCQTHMAAMAGNGLRRNWQIACPLVLYRCGVSQDAFRTDAVLANATATTISAAIFATKPDGYFTGGFVRWATGTFTEHRFVIGHVGDTLTLMTPTALATGAAVAAFPGCDHSLATCNSKFGNAPGYGGQHTIPKKNPFGSDPVF